MEDEPVLKPEKVFKRYDIRGKYPEEIDDEFAKILGKAVGTWSLRNSTGRVLVTRDTKETSKALKKELIKGVKSAGATVFDAGAGPTDYTAVNSKYQEAVGVQVTSSHLPVEFNGFKLIYPEGNGFVNEDLYEVQDIFRERDFREQIGSVEKVEASCRDRYVSNVKEYFKQFFETIDAKIVYDSMGGAGGLFLPELLEDLGADLTDISDVDEIINPPNPKPENLRHVEDKVKELDADIGLVTDMDADRLAVYHEGEWLNGNELFSVFAQIIQPEKIVASIDTSSIVENSFDGDISYTRVGDPFVISKSLQVEAELSGEPNGHYSFTGFVPYNSGTLAALLVAASDINSLKGQIPGFSNITESFEVDNKRKELEKLKEEVRECHEIISEVDGIKFKVGDAIVLVRSSGSSNKLRIVVDGEHVSSVKDALEQVKELF